MNFYPSTSSLTDVHQFIVNSCIAINVALLIMCHIVSAFL